MELLFPWVAQPSDAVSLRVGDRALSQRELVSAIGGVIATLRGRGAEPGARVGVWTKPAIETLVAFTALAAGGYVVVPMDPKLGEGERAHVEATAKPAVILGPEDVDLAASGAWTPAPIDGRTALLLFTSGTTGAPKAAAITDRNIAANLDMLAEAWGWTGADTVVHALPLFHIHGLVLGLYGALRRGGTLRWVPRFTPADLAAAVGDEAGRGAAIVFAGYLDRPDATAAVMDADGWFYTGDVATVSDDGFVTIIGRRSTDIIKCGGFKVGAGEIEACLCEHPAVSEAAVIGAPDPDLGERIVAFVVARSPIDPAVLVDHVAARLSPHKRPREVKILDALPRNAMGKVVKTALRGR